MRAFLEIAKGEKVVEARKSKSFVIGFVGLIVRQWCQDTDALYDTGGNLRTKGSIPYTFYCEGQGGMGLRWQSLYGNMEPDVESDRFGIVIGSGTGTVAPTDYALGTQIRSGDTTSKIFYHGTAIRSFSTAGGSSQFKIEAIFQNLSGGSIDVKEVGLYCSGYTDVSISYPNKFGYCILRDNITTIALANGEFMRVTYTISITA